MQNHGSPYLQLRRFFWRSRKNKRETPAILYIDTAADCCIGRNGEALLVLQKGCSKAQTTGESYCLADAKRRLRKNKPAPSTPRFDPGRRRPPQTASLLP